MKARYDRNFEALSDTESELLRTKRICIVGCGGLGGYILGQFLRIGVGSITVIDGDCFEEIIISSGVLNVLNAGDTIQYLNGEYRILKQ